MTRTITVDYDLPGPPAKVWRALTEPALDLGVELEHASCAFTVPSFPAGGSARSGRRFL